MGVLIAGAGIGGLTLALSLHAIGISVKIFESVSEIRPLGVGINLQPHAIRELEALGLLTELDKIALRTQKVAYYSSHGQEIWSEPRGMFAGYNWPQFSIHRGKLQMLLLSEVKNRLGDDAVVMGAAVQSWTESKDCIEVNLHDRKNNRSAGSVKGSVLIGADGIHSTVRSIFYPDEGPPKWGGIMMWRGVTLANAYAKTPVFAMIGCKNRKFVCYPIGERDGKVVINWIADLARPEDYNWNREDWNREGNLDDYLPEFQSMSFDWIDVPAIINGAEKSYEFPMVDRDPLPQWTYGRVTLLGDAAHPMYPIGSNGATQAIIDTRVLARELQNHGLNNAALQAYETERRETTGKIVMANRGDGPDKILDLVEFRAPNGFEQLHDVLTEDELTEIASGYKKLAGFDVDALNSSKPILTPTASR